MENKTTVNMFILLGLSNDSHFQIPFFMVFLVIYLITLVGNILIIMVIKIDSHLHTPMYFFLCNLSFLDVCYSSVTVPKILEGFLAEQKTISLSGCIAQIFFFIFMVGTEIFLLSAMAYDRYVAICNPLRYSTTMNHRVCMQMVLGAWISVLLFCGTAFIRYMRPASGYSLAVDKLISVQYSILTPMLNPIIYSLKNKEVKVALRKVLGR
ncbi:olfactory receptor 2D3-like [Alligator mississippiensis]|uniref:olfactory receptor 2D3-like n=1 Tax=Alligator mississippiensis TaxID=8496 RepID=UPI002877784E|nr:olfactory receptor 2D3-like [Alligator mississippiensis]